MPSMDMDRKPNVKLPGGESQKLLGPWGVRSPSLCSVEPAHMAMAVAGGGRARGEKPLLVIVVWL